MKEIYEGYKKEILEKRIILITIVVFVIIGIIFGSIYITIIDDESKKLIIESVNNYFYSFNNISFSDKLIIFKNSLINNLVYFCSMWLLGISIIGLPIIYILLFFKSFKIGFSISGIIAKYKFMGVLGAIIYLIPSNIVILVLGLILGCYSVNLSFNILRLLIKKKSVNLSNYIGKYLFLLLICILLSVICSLFEAFISPLLYKLINNLLLS